MGETGKLREANFAGFAFASEGVRELASFFTEVSRMEQISYSKKIPVYGSFDVCVIGGGPAGVCAAVEAARNGSDVLLCERTGMLGGSASALYLRPVRHSPFLLFPSFRLHGMPPHF